MIYIVTDGFVFDGVTYKKQRHLLDSRKDENYAKAFVDYQNRYYGLGTHRYEIEN